MPMTDDIQALKQMLVLAEQEEDKQVQLGMFRVIAHMAVIEVEQVTACVESILEGQDDELGFVEASPKSDGRLS